MFFKQPHEASNLMAQTKSLNPGAQEWRPPSSKTPKATPLKAHQLLPHIIFGSVSPPPQTAAPALVQLAPPPAPALVPLAPPPLEMAAYHYSIPFPAGYQGFALHGPCITQPRPPVYSCYPPPCGYPFPAEEAPVFVVEEKREGPTRGFWGPRLKGPKKFPVAAWRKGAPPRLRRAIRSFPSEKKKPPSVQRWRPKESGSGNVGAVSGGAPAAFARNPTGEKFSPWKTTVMIKNIPNQLRRSFMLEFLDGWCKTYSLEYDFLYLPMDFKKEDNLGYAFVNFTTADAAHRFKKILQKYKWNINKTINSQKICEITWARIQGKERLMQRFEDTPFACCREDFLPVLLDPPRNGSDPNPSLPVVVGVVSDLRGLCFHSLPGIFFWWLKAGVKWKHNSFVWWGYEKIFTEDYGDGQKRMKRKKKGICSRFCTSILSETIKRTTPRAFSKIAITIGGIQSQVTGTLTSNGVAIYDESLRASRAGRPNFRVEILEFSSGLDAAKFLNWWATLKCVLAFKDVPDDRRVALVAKRLLSQQFQNLRQGQRSVDDDMEEFNRLLTRVDVHCRPNRFAVCGAGQSFISLSRAGATIGGKGTGMQSGSAATGAGFAPRAGSATAPSRGVQRAAEAETGGHVATT
ncbi:MEI2 C-terminal RRM only like 1 [Striga asiatica]|uniref:MEI2 C-terminal RRM only like 1 n=1 Tax=Striga asiatica TaxID=4170 RepID=A0A5A7Q5W2_STRAF|nr:MEI2 C-terminal RRM only like 1 [Striga asiatica]